MMKSFEQKFQPESIINKKESQVRKLNAPRKGSTLDPLFLKYNNFFCVSQEN